MTYAVFHFRTASMLPTDPPITIPARSLAEAAARLLDRLGVRWIMASCCRHHYMQRDGSWLIVEALARDKANMNALDQLRVRFVGSTFRPNVRLTLA